MNPFVIKIKIKRAEDQCGHNKCNHIIIGIIDKKQKGTSNQDQYPVNRFHERTSLPLHVISFPYFIIGVG